MNKEASQISRLGIMGGTFDPIHYGHLVTAEGARYEYDLEKVIFIPAGQPPHKPNFKRTDAWRRYEMTRLAVATNPFFEESSIEIERPGPTYTIDTVKEISRLHPGTQIFFITGADAVAEILTWKKVEELLSICRFIAASRPGYKPGRIWKKIKDLPREFKSNIFSMEVPALAISSTDIRQRVREGKPIKYLLPEPVEEYIVSNNIYQD